MSDDRVPPHDLVAEQSTLGSMMLSKDAIWDVLGVVEAGDFYQPKHETIFRAIRALVDAESPVDMISVGDELQRKGMLQKAGDLAYLAELTSVTISPVNAAYYAGIVRDHGIRRRMIEAAQRVVHAGYSGEGEAAELLEAGRAELDRVVRASTTEVRNVAGAFTRVVDEMGKPPKSTPTPWSRLDELIGGLMPGKLYIIGARPGAGKSMAGLQLAKALCVRGNVAFSSLEMSEDEIVERLIAQMADVNYSSMTRHSLTDEEWGRVAMVRHRIEPMPLFVDERSGVTITQIKSFARSVARKGTLGGVVVDYLQLVSGAGSDQKRFEIVSEVSRQLKVMAKDLDCPVVALSQLNRESAGVGKNRRDPTLADLRESGSIEQDADVVMLLQRVLEQDGQPGHVLEVHVAKNRSGRTGKRKLRWEANFARLASFTPMHFDMPRDDD